MQRWVRFGLLMALMGVGSGSSRLAIGQVPGQISGQARLSDRDLERLMQNLKNDAQPFKQSFANAIKKSTIRGTSQAKDAQALGGTFAKQAEGTLNIFKSHKKADQAVAAMVQTAGQIDPLVYKLQLNPATTSQWEKIRSELHLIAQADAVNEPYFGSPAAATPIASAGGCVGEVGVDRSRDLVNECLQVSPATHPPCNAANACSLIVDEIKRGCGLIGAGAPEFCSAYR